MAYGPRYFLVKLITTFSLRGPSLLVQELHWWKWTWTTWHSSTTWPALCTLLCYTRLVLQSNNCTAGWGTVALTSNYSSDLQELNIQMTSMMEKTSSSSVRRQPLYRCTLCGKEAEKNDLRKHIESKHLEGISIPCTECDKTFRSRGSLSMHRSREHK